MNCDECNLHTVNNVEFELATLIRSLKIHKRLHFFIEINGYLDLAIYASCVI